MERLARSPYRTQPKLVSLTSCLGAIFSSDSSSSYRDTKRAFYFSSGLYLSSRMCFLYILILLLYASLHSRSVEGTNYREIDAALALTTLSAR